jgi:hypothetical protein
MMHVAISVPDENLESWIETIAELANLRTVELSLHALTQRPEALRQASRQGIQVIGVRELIPGEIGRHFESVPAKVLTDAAMTLTGKLGQLRLAGAEFATLDLGLEATSEPAEAEGFDQRVKFLKRIVVPCNEQHMKLCLAVRYPPERPQSNAWRLAANIVHDTMHPACRLAVDFFPHEVGEKFDVSEFLRGCGFHLGLVRLHYEPMLGDELTEERVLAWARALRWHGFKGTVVLAPRISHIDALPGVCRRAEGWAQLLINEGSSSDESAL